MEHGIEEYVEYGRNSYVMEYGMMVALLHSMFVLGGKDWLYLASFPSLAFILPPWAGRTGSKANCMCI